MCNYFPLFYCVGGSSERCRLLPLSLRRKTILLVALLDPTTTVLLGKFVTHQRYYCTYYNVIARAFFVKKFCRVLHNRNTFVTWASSDAKYRYFLCRNKRVLSVMFRRWVFLSCFRTNDVFGPLAETAPNTNLRSCFEQIKKKKKKTVILHVYVLLHEMR